MPPTPADEGGRQLLGEGAPIARVEGAQHLDRANQAVHRGDALKGEGAQKQWPDPAHEGMVTFRERQVVGTIRPDEGLRLFDHVDELVPGHDLGHRVERILPGFLGVYQRHANLGEQSNLLVDGTGVALQFCRRPAFRAAKQPPNQSVKDANGVVGQALCGVEYSHQQNGATPRRRQRPQMLRC